MWRLSSDFVGLVAFGYFCCFVPFFPSFFGLKDFVICSVQQAYHF